MSGSLAAEEQLKDSDVVTSVLGVMVTVDKFGDRFKTVDELLSMAEPLLGSVTVAVHSMASPTDAVVEVKTKLALEPRTCPVVVFCH